MPDVTVPWGDEELPISLPNGWTLQQVASPQVRDASPNWPDELAMAINKPVAGAALEQLLRDCKGGRIAIIVEDLTRHSPLAEILEVLLREIRHAGISDQQLEFVFASGMHPPMTSEEARIKLGPAAKGISHRCNPWNNPDAYVNVGKSGKMDVLIDRGVVEADLRIIVSSVSPHLQAGFGGGYKMFFPGCGELRSIRNLHQRGIKRRNQGQMVGTSPQSNVMRKTIDTAGSLVDSMHGQTFTIQYLLDQNDNPTNIAAGTPLPTHLMVTKQCAVACGIISTAQPDVLITNAHPRDHDLWQAFKCIPNTCWATRPGGVVICLARCPAGLNKMETIHWPLSPLWTRRIVRLLKPENICSLVNRLVTHLAGDSQWFIRLATQILDRNHLIMVSPNLVEQNAKFPGIAICATVEEALAAAGKLLGNSPQRVSVYPFGGASYPVVNE